MRKIKTFMITFNYIYFFPKALGLKFADGALFGSTVPAPIEFGLNDPAPIEFGLKDPAPSEFGSNLPALRLLGSKLPAPELGLN
jgi:hypothetical protein